MTKNTSQKKAEEYLRSKEIERGQKKLRQHEKGEAAFTLVTVAFFIALIVSFFTSYTLTIFLLTSLVIAIAFAMLGVIWFQVDMFIISPLKTLFTK